MIELLVIGLGSPFGDDRIGWDVVQLLQQRRALTAYTENQLQFACYDRPGLNLLELIQNAKSVFLIDAVRTGAEIGTLVCLKEDEINVINTIGTTHHFGVAEAIQMGKVLNLLPQNLILYGIEIDELNFQFEVSKLLKKALQALIEQIEKNIITHMNSLKSTS
ncbi:hydrogenase expression/formation protein [Legionella nautarum]|uniref:Hydrogenase expression/formation protein n=1 Tax=Legionella nautarum TaxID=45070 RepID=A0A0W0WRU0_9GAMM|nr:hydrogenase maturation protease [Legionella nautarum]KTD35042.1 hydrogenase expression/formation protein [Legionella nautarum]